MFSMIKAVLEDAQEKQLKYKAINNWLQILNVAAYEVDDILDNCKTEAARYKQALLGRYRTRTITFCYNVVKRMKEVMEKLDAIAEKQRDFHLDERTVDRQAARRQTGADINFILKLISITNRRGTKEFICIFIFDNYQTHVCF